MYQSNALPVEVPPRGSDWYELRTWFRRKLEEYGENYWTVATLPFKLDTSQVTNMESMFYGCSSLTSVPEMDTSQVTNMESMFYGCSSLTQVPEMDTSQVTNMRAMFDGCSSLTDGNVKLIRKDGTKPSSRTYMIAGSGLTREPFFMPDGTPID
ncbi:BspA family leucine-rich repeat surface protein [Corynebacterium sp. MSK041]|uniref:BspA family leucine-rich repeat surface protein n=1 Tax=Corynebacterium sp. MSK041 TaxID=3050194 RepID=UPI00254C32E8|nr:BspA family leucine-rich repeat surface protein [Corynebacterium sp. MSK041]MDK8794248.1 BspA family leucine-rich repeat surface protein [Corynebacterium sp. MSK041]